MSGQPRATALLIDGHSLIYRSFFAFIRNPLRNAKGENTSAVFGFANTLRKLFKTLQPEYCAVVFDAPAKTFRHELFEQYKIQRPPVPDEMISQIPVVKELARAWNLAVFEIPGVEADDVLATLARRTAEKGLEVVIATSDKDMMQVVGGPVMVYDPWMEKRFGPQEVMEKLGVGPELVADYLALTGDASDNVPGVPGIGPKRALDILGRHGSLEQALAAEPKLKGYENVARMSRDLTQVDTGVELEFDLDELRTKEADSERLRSIFEEMGFHSLLKEFGAAQAGPVEVVTLKADAGVSAGVIAFRFEVDTGLWLSEKHDRVWFVERGRDAEMRRILAASVVTKVGYGLKEQVKRARRAGFEIAEPMFDVGVGAWLLDPNRRGYDIEDLTAQVLGRATVPAGPEQEPPLALELFGKLEPELAARGLDPVARNIEMPLVSVLAEMEERGIRVDVDYLGQLEHELGQEAERVEKSILKQAGVEFNISSPKQLAEVLFDKLGLPRGRRTKTGFSTDSAVLEDLAPYHSIVAEIVYYRELAKLRNTYIGPLCAMARPETGRVHCEFNQTGTGTGRLSSSNPNLQNIPIRTELGKKIRNAFTAEPGCVLLSADYSQIELRVLAHLAGDEELKRAFGQGEDIHVHTAASVFGVGPESVTAEQRRMAKVVNYGLIYGMGDYGLSWRMSIPREQARGFLDDYMTRFCGVAAWRERILAEVVERGFVRSISGRMRPFPGVVSSNRNVAEAAKRAAVNAPVQGSAADIMKQAMLNVSCRLKAESLGAGVVVQVHDELLIEAKESEVETVKALVRTEMENAWRLDVPLVVDIGTGRTWGEAH